jgi:alkanesulfonate monooxygenase SsuD/methylene tetrahydromethanopterin reductase-like flavin-dependent oxidoreductase (luciferase family)
MKFGYFTLSDNHYDNNIRAANDFIADIIDEAIYAEEVGLHSAWIGEHHFSTLGVLSCPDLVLANVAARTKRIRLAPAVTVLPLHHPIRVAEQWATLDLLSGGRVDFAAGRGYDRREYLPLNVSFEDNQEIFEEGMEIVRRLWSSDGPISHHGKHYRFDHVTDHPTAAAAPAARVCSLVHAALDRAGRQARLRSNRGALRRRNDLWRTAPSEGAL